MKDQTVKPFLKWAGGKRWLTGNISHFLPKSFNYYFEPFLGSGAVYFSIQPQKSILSDINLPLIETYNAIKKDYLRVYNSLLDHSLKHNTAHYYKVRETIYENSFDQAARFIYLNRTCFNAIYRVNKKGQFNVPKGSKDSVILDTDNFKAISKILQSAEINHSDFEPIIHRANKGDLIYVDPPYTIKHNNNGFVKYNEKMFTWQDQERLWSKLYEAQRRGAKVIVSNADHVSIRELYSQSYLITPLQRSSVIASDPNNRGLYSEVLIEI